MRRNSDDAIRELARRIYEGDTSLIPLLARLHERTGGEPVEVWLVERWGSDNDRGEADRWVLPSYEDATMFVAVLMLDEIDTEIGENDAHGWGWVSPERERAWKQGRLRARRALRSGNYVGVVEAWEGIRTDAIHFARNGVKFVSRPLRGDLS